MNNDTVLKPSIRFKEYSDNWNYRPLNKIVNCITTGKLDANAAVKHGKYKFFTCSKEDFFTDTYAFDGDAVIINGNGDLGITKTYSGKFDAYQRTYVLMNFNDNFKYIGKAIPKYLPERIRTEAIGGAMPYIKLDTLSELLIGEPTIIEQKDIAELLENVEKLLEDNKKELSKIMQYKESLLGKMFPNVVETVPSIRFKNYTSLWKKDCFGNLFDKLLNNSFSRDMLNYSSGYVKNIHYGDVLIKFNSIVDVNSKIVPYINKDVKIANIKSKDYLISGDVVFSDTAEDTTAGKMVEIYNANNKRVVSGLHTFACRPKIKFAEGFLGIYLNTNQFHGQLIKYMQGSKVTGYNYDFLCKIEVSYPSIDEQKDIVEMFTQLDQLIDDINTEIKKTENVKSILMDKMFI